MKPSEALRKHRTAVLAIAASIGAGNVRVFGSVLHGQDTEESDIDLLLDMVRLQKAIKKELGVATDVLTAGDLPPKFRNQVLAEARQL